MNTISSIIIGALIIAVCAALWAILSSKNSGCSGCTGDCSKCGMQHDKDKK